MSDKKEEMTPEYKFDYGRVKSNRFADKNRQTQRTVVLDSDVTENFPSSESVNEALRFLIRVTRENQNALHK
jgi:hypothetical protein